MGLPVGPKKISLASVPHCHRCYLRLGGSVAQKCQRAITTVIPARAHQTTLAMDLLELVSLLLGLQEEVRIQAITASLQLCSW